MKNLFALLKSLFYPFLLLMSYEKSNAQAREYHYSPYEKPDPFDPSLLLKSASEGFPPLQASPLRSMTLVGTIIGQKAAAMILAPGEKSEKRTYIVKLGDRLGSNSGTVIAILADRIIVREPIEREGNSDFAKFQDTALVLRTHENTDSAALSLNDAASGPSKKKSLVQALTEDLVPDQSNSLSLFKAGGNQKLESYNSVELSDLKNNLTGNQNILMGDSSAQTQAQTKQQTQAPLQVPSLPQASAPFIQTPSASSGSISSSAGSFSTEIRSLSPAPASSTSGVNNVGKK